MGFRGYGYGFLWNTPGLPVQFPNHNWFHFLLMYRCVEHPFSNLTVNLPLSHILSWNPRDGSSCFVFKRGTCFDAARRVFPSLSCCIHFDMANRIWPSSSRNVHLDATSDKEGFLIEKFTFFWDTLAIFSCMLFILSTDLVITWQAMRGENPLSFSPVTTKLRRQPPWPTNTTEAQCCVGVPCTPAILFYVLNASVAEGFSSTWHILFGILHVFLADDQWPPHMTMTRSAAARQL